MKRYGVRMGTIAVATTLCIAGFVVFAISLTGGPRMDHCKRMLRDFSENRGRQSKNFDPVEVSDCLAAECKFDHHQCQNQCPFGYVTDDARSCATSCECALQGRFQGDISFKPKQIDNMLMEFGHKDSEEFSVRLAHYDKLWRNVEVNGRYKIPYLLDKTLDVQQYHAVDDMIKNISQRTCIDMIPRTSEEDFVYITKAGTVCRCEGRAVEYDSCQIKECPSLDGIWSPWSMWSNCSSTCGTAIKQKYRICTPENSCTGYPYEYASCDLPACNSSRDGTTGSFGTWTLWGNWSRCEGDCQQATQFRVRSCELNNARVKSTSCVLIPGLPLVDTTGRLQLKYCVHDDCSENRALQTVTSVSPVLARYYSMKPHDPWEQWSTCTKTCGGGGRRRYRLCPSGACYGTHVQWEKCNQFVCTRSSNLFKNNRARVAHSCIYGMAYMGRLNNDNIPDVLCMYPDGYIEVFLVREDSNNIGINNYPDYQGQTGNCNFVRGSGVSQIFVRDVTMDGLDDLICRNPFTKNVEINVNRGDGTFGRDISWKSPKESCNLVAVEDVNGDNKPDLVCIESSAKGDGMYAYLNVR